jgi:hypothetical protein
MEDSQAMREQAVRRGVETALRFVACCLMAWAFAVGSYSFPATYSAAIALITLLSLLATYELMIRDVSPENVFCAIVAIVIMVMGSYGIWRAMQPPEPSGALMPAGEPTPAGPCPEKPGDGDLAMLFADNRVIAKGPGLAAPFTVDGCPVLKLLRKGGGLMVEATGYNWTNDVAFMVRDNLYQPFEPLLLRVYRPDRSTFVVLDRFDQEVVYVRYLNRNAVRIRGRFLCGEQPQALVRDQGIFTGGVRIAGAYLGLKRAGGGLCATVRSGDVGIAIGKAE